MTQKRKRAALALWLLLLAGLLTSCAGMPGGNVPGVTDAPGTSGSQTTTRYCYKRKSDGCGF